MLHISLLGEQAITDRTTGSALARSSWTVALVGYLAPRAGSPVSRQRLAGLFWPESTDAQALTNLRRELHHLRTVLGDEPSLVVTPRDLCWRDTDSCDVDLRAFAAARQAAFAAEADGDWTTALACADDAVVGYGGPFLPGTDAGWVHDIRAALEQQFVEICDLICRVRLRVGDPAAAVTAGRRRIRVRPLEEVGYRLLMQLHADMGDRAGAVSTYHHCASVLERELGLDPDQETRQLLQRLLARDRPSALTGSAAAAAGAIEPRRGPAAARLVGRRDELALLDDAWARAAAGPAGMVVVRGESGLGKTRLVAELAGRARKQGAVVATSQCFGTSGQLALAPVADWLRNSAFQAATDRLDPVWRAEVDRLVPGVGGPAGGRPVPRAMVDAWQRHRFFEGMARALAGTDRPTLLVLDNLQWCDVETLTFLTFLVGFPIQDQFLIAATQRDGNADDRPEVSSWLSQLRAHGLLEEVPLGPLDGPDTALLAEAIAGRRFSSADAQLLQETTGGFPLHIVEAARTAAQLARAAVPVGDLVGVLDGRVEQVSSLGREVAGLAAAVGKDFSLDLLAEASDLDPDTVVRAVDELWRHRIIRELRDGYDFSHDLLREAAYRRVSPPKRWLLHRRLAQALELLHANDTDAVSAQLAEQYARGGRPARALAYYARAADVAAARFAHGEAIRLRTEALDLVRALPAGSARDRRELEVLEALAAPLNARDGYASPVLQARLVRSIDLARELGRRQSMLTASIGLWASQFVQGKLDDAHTTAARALEQVEPDSELAGPAYFAFAGSALSAGQPADAVRHFRTAFACTKGRPSLSIGTRPDVHGTAWSAHAHWLLGHEPAAARECRAAIVLARAIEHPYSLAVALAYGAITAQLRGDRDSLRHTVDELRELCERYAFAYYREWGLVLDGWYHRDERGVEQGIATLRAQGSLTRMPYWLALLADVHADRGRPAAARAALDAALADGHARRDLWWLPEVMRLRARYDTEPQTAADRLRAAADLARAQGSLALLRRCAADLTRFGAGHSTCDVRAPR